MTYLAGEKHNNIYTITRNRPEKRNAINVEILKMGVIADVGGTSRLSRLLGPSRAMEILMTGREYSAQQALDWGLINYHYAAEDLIGEAENCLRILP
ncbi:MAG: hypothetical protein GY850_24920 [bacterium]|nr:hypothetical protein [bacterium]